MAPKPITENTLFYGDNFDILHQYRPDNSVDLIYLDPPFNSSRNYNVLFKDESGKESEAQITAFEDTWYWNEVAEETYNHPIPFLKRQNNYPTSSNGCWRMSWSSLRCR